MPRRRVTPAAEEVQHDPLDHDDQGNDEQINRTESADSSPAESRDRNQSQRARRGCSGCSDGLKRTCGCGRCYCCSHAALDDFMQQRLSTWEPLLTPRRILFALFGVGLLFVVVGLVILLVNSAIVECRVDYTNMTGDLELKIDASTCTDTSITEITGDVLLYYELSNYFQNHRHFMKSRSDKQLGGKVFTAASEVSSSCDPRVESADGRILHPCGLSAAAVFTDEFSAVGEDKTTEIELDESRDAICWNFDLSSFKNPTEEEMQGVASKVKFWLYDQPYVDSLHMEKAGVGWGVENSHFIVWMKDAPLPVFRKAYARFVQQPLKLPFYLKVTNNTYDVKSFGGSKSVVIGQASWLGGRTSFLGIAYLVVGSVCLLFFGVLFYYHRRNPRHLGDVSWLRRALYA
ncbi:LEM3 / CDC50 family protein, putative [Eimeria tenella]|uniref:LEM3 / CDC50 family protein, putative n=1 Tax=Eimeria tenella TaxID=5802 RepID=U6KSH5_EIMTE|nr:LEM3 / CDC50 family protein, putative [Eimeria tenella]CDJ39334.1 LEM3 / CDC50 family protein, putative [Eimeria tenella]|eukprot:XP_013230089.1 LEM3 / CDC50 family protein, putative [Eimeria tenella]